MQRGFSIQNSRNVVIRGAADWYGKAYGPPVIFSHGLVVTHTQAQVRDAAQRVAQAGYVSYRFTATNHVGTSQGSLRNFTVDGYVGDLRCVIDYALRETQHHYCYLVGYSLGSMVSYIVAADDDRVRRMVLQSPLYDFDLEIRRKLALPPYRAIGWGMQYSRWLRERFRLGTQYYEEGIRYDPAQLLAQVHAPTLVVYGTKDRILRHSNFTDIYDKLTVEKRLVPLSGAGHTFRSSSDIHQLAELIIEWFNADSKEKN